MSEKPTPPPVIKTWQLYLIIIAICSAVLGFLYWRSSTVEKGLAQCPSCYGLGKVPCEICTTACDLCGLRGGPRPCRLCGLVGVRPGSCPNCEGAKDRPCGNCREVGSFPCTTCGGSGTFR